MPTPRVVDITEAKAQLSRLGEQGQVGGTVVIGRAGRPVPTIGV